MSWKKHVQVVNVDSRIKAALARAQRDAPSGSSGTGGKFSSVLPEVYAGHPLRIERYGQYDAMDMDSEINAAVDTIADFCTQADERSGDMFEIMYNGDPGDTEVEVLRSCLHQWCRVNDFQKRLWRMFRSTIKYGDQFFIRDPETLKWFWVDQTKVEKVLVNEAEGKEPEAYLIKDLDLNLQALTATDSDQYGSNIVGTGTNTLQNINRMGPRVDNKQNTFVVDATHVVHLSLSEGLDANWPFGTSILESVFKTFRQKELLEDAIIIYRIQRAPERRVFYVDVGDMPPHKAGAYLERVKNEIHQRRFPTRNGGGNAIDAAYNPMSMIEDYFFAQTADGRGSKVDTLPGGENLGQIDDLKFWTNKLLRGLRVPSSYLPTGPDDGQQTYNDGRAGTAYIQEFRFAQYCRRLQNLLAATFDDEFKLFVKQRGYNVDAGLFYINFNVPQHFSDFARVERDAAMINVFQPLVELKYFSKRFLMQRYLGMSEDEIIQNETMWREENPEAVNNAGGDDSAGSADVPGLESMGIRPEGWDDMEGMSADMDMDDAAAEPTTDSVISGGEGVDDGGGEEQQ